MCKLTQVFLYEPYIYYIKMPKKNNILKMGHYKT